MYAHTYKHNAQARKDTDAWITERVNQAYLDILWKEEASPHRH